jgi:hypothetical protein
VVHENGIDPFIDPCTWIDRRDHVLLLAAPR